MEYFTETVSMLKQYARQLKEDGHRAVVKSGIKDSCPISVSEFGLSLLKSRVENCMDCALCSSRKNVVFGEGSASAELMFIGEGPGFEEDRTGRAFVGPAGKLLDKIIAAMKLSREDVYITNIVKCHPMKDPHLPDTRGNDRKPVSEEIAACMPYLMKQIELVTPKIICALGASASCALLNVNEPISSLRGRFYDYNNIKLIPTYHPAAILRNAALKINVWHDMQMIMNMLKENIPQ